MCEDPCPDRPFMTIDFAVEVCRNIESGAVVNSNDVLDIRAYCYVNGNFSAELKDRLKMEVHLIYDLLDRAVFIIT